MLDFNGNVTHQIREVFVRVDRPVGLDYVSNELNVARAVVSRRVQNLLSSGYVDKVSAGIYVITESGRRVHKKMAKNAALAAKYGYNYKAVMHQMEKTAVRAKTIRESVSSVFDVSGMD